MKTTVVSAYSVKSRAGWMVAGLLVLAIAIQPEVAQADSVETVAAVLVGAALLYAATDDRDNRKRSQDDKHYRNNYRPNHHGDRGHYTGSFRDSHWDRRDKHFRDHDNGRRDGSDRGKAYNQHGNHHKGGKHDNGFRRDDHRRADARFNTRVFVR